MSKLTDFYAHKAAINEQDNTRWEQLEDQLLKEELLPELMEHLKTVLSKVKCPLMFTGSYDPTGVLSVSFTRNCIIANSATQPQAHEKKLIPKATPSPSAITAPDEHIRKKAKSLAETGQPVTTPHSPVSIQYEPTKQVVNYTKGLKVTFPDGTVVAERTANDTLIRVLQRIGLAKVASSGLTHGGGYGLVSKTMRPVEAGRTWQHKVGGYYVYVNISNQQKKDDLMKLSEMFGLGLKIEDGK